MDASSSIEIARHTLLSCGLILAIGTLSALLAQRIRIPDVAIFLVAGYAGLACFGLFAATNVVLGMTAPVTAGAGSAGHSCRTARPGTSWPTPVTHAGYTPTPRRPSRAPPFAA